MLCSTSIILVALVRTIFALPHSSNSPSSKSPLPLIIWHGLGDRYDADGIKEVGKIAQEVHPGTYIYTIRISDNSDDDRKATFWGNATIHIEEVCEALASHPVLSKASAVNALGFSQGGLFLRSYVERCNNPPVRNLITFGSPHNGIVDYIPCKDGDWLCKGAMALLHSNTWSGFVQSNVIPAQYYRDLNPETGFGSENYLLYSNWLADINNEREDKNETYKANLASLERLVMYKFDEDTTVIPSESEWFDEVNPATLEVLPLKSRPIYTEDWIGLKKLDEKGGIVFKIAPGQHMHITRELLEETFKEFYGPTQMPLEVSDSMQETLEL